VLPKRKSPGVGPVNSRNADIGCLLRIEHVNMAKITGIERELHLGSRPYPPPQLTQLGTVVFQPFQLDPIVEHNPVHSHAQDDVQRGGAESLFVLLPDGVQHISPFVASLLRSANSFGDVAPVAISPDRIAPVPVVDHLPVSYYPTTRLHLVDTTVDGTTCLSWSKGSTDKAAQITVLSGQGLPIPATSDERLVHVVKDAPREPNSVEADRVYVDPNATNLVMSTNADPSSVSRDSLWWISGQGVRFGIALQDSALRPLGIATASVIARARLSTVFSITTA